MTKHDLGEERHEDTKDRNTNRAPCVEPFVDYSFIIRRPFGHLFSFAKQKYNINHVLITKHDLSEERDEDPREPPVLIVY